MPGSLVTINRSGGLTWYVGDSRMEELIRFLHSIGTHQQPEGESIESSWPDPDRDETE